MAKKLVAALMCVCVAAASVYAVPPSGEVQAAESSKGTTYYISSTRGDNSKSGKSQGEAWETLDKLEGVTLKAGDQVLLEKGSVFNGFIHLKDVHGSEDAPIKIGTYGSGNKPVINGNGQGIWYQDYNGSVDNAGHRSKGYVSSTILLYDVDYVEIEGLEITNKSDDFDYFGDNIGKGKGRMDRTGVSGLAKNGGTMEHIYLDDLYIHDVAGNIEDKHMNNGGIQMNATPPDKTAKTSEPARFSDIKVRNCYVKDVSRTGISIGYTYLARKFDGAAISDEVMKQWGNGYIECTGNYVQNAGGDAIVVMYADSPLIERNISDNAGADLALKSTIYPDYTWMTYCAAIWPWKTKDAVFQYNEAFDTVQENNGDGQAWDIDYSDGTLYQYNYSHNNGGGALLVCQTEAYDGTFRYNISQNDLKAFVTLQNNPDTKIHNNVFYLDGDLETAVHHPQNDKRNGSAHFANNIFYNVSTGKHVIVGGDGEQTWTPGGEKQKFEKNIYYGYDKAKTGKDLPEEKAITEDPKFVNPGHGPTEVQESHKIYDRGGETFAGYKIQESSPAINAGVYVEPSGAAKKIGKETDFFGNPIGMMPDIGVHEKDIQGEDPTVDVQSSSYDVEGEVISDIPEGTTVEEFLEHVRVSSGAAAQVMRENKPQTGETEIEWGDTFKVSLKTRAGDSQKEYKLKLTRTADSYKDYDRSNWGAEAGSEEKSQNQQEAAKALDGNLDTLWHTSWNSCNQDDVWLIIDMKKEQPVSRLRYIPRKNQSNGIFKKYKIEVSTDNSKWTEIDAGTWDGNNSEQTAEFATVSARYIRLTGVETLTEEKGKIFGSAAEIYIGYDKEDAPENEEGGAGAESAQTGEEQQADTAGSAENGTPANVTDGQQDGQSEAQSAGQEEQAGSQQNAQPDSQEGAQESGQQDIHSDDRQGAEQGGEHDTQSDNQPAGAAESTQSGQASGQSAGQ